jgi:hypothetical protein
MGPLAFIAVASLLVPATARAGFFDRLKEATNAWQKIKQEVGNRLASNPAPANSQPASTPASPISQPAAQPAPANPQPTVNPGGPVSQPLAANPAGTQSGALTIPSASGTLSPVAAAQKVVGPLLSDPTVSDPNGGGFAYTVSLHGSHLASAHMQGSRYVVTVDGVTGPRVDAVLAVYDALSASMGTREAVVMSDDGRHYAYLARVGGKIEVVEDGRNILQFPRNAYAFPYYLVFSPHGGAHLLFAAQSSPEEDEVLWVDGKPAPADIPTPPGVNPIVTFSADGQRYLYVGTPALGSSKRVLVVDGKKQSYSIDGFSQGLLAPRFTADGRHVLVVTNAYVGRNGEMLGKVLLDGKPVVTAYQIDSLVTAPKGSSYAVVVTEGPNGFQEAVYLNGKEIPATRNSTNNNGGPDAGLLVARFSPDGKHLAVACNCGAGNAYVVLDGKQGDTYDKIHAGSDASDPGAMKFSPDSKSFGYFANAGPKSFAVVDGHEYDPGFEFEGKLYFSPEGHHVAVIGEKADASGQVLYVDGKLVFAAPGGVPGTFAFNRDGSHWMFYGQGLVVDGRSLPGSWIQDMRCPFSPDGSEVALVGEAVNGPMTLYLYNCSTGRMRPLTQGSIIAANLFPSYNGAVHTYYQFIFSPDSQHLYYAREETKSQEAIIYVDGEKTAVQFAPTLFPPEGNLPSGEKNACWQVGADNKLHALCAVGNEVERITITPPSGGLGAM